MLKITRLKRMCYAGRRYFLREVTDSRCTFWIMNLFPICGSETHFYLFSLFNKDVVSVPDPMLYQGCSSDQEADRGLSFNEACSPGEGAEINQIMPL